MVDKWLLMSYGVISRVLQQPFDAIPDLVIVLDIFKLQFFFDLDSELEGIIELVYELW